jgi:hypothetical protein
MSIIASKFSIRSVCGVALATLISTTPFGMTHATANKSPNKNVPNFAGTWQINRKKSDDLQDKLRQVMSTRRSGGQSSGAHGSPAGEGFPGSPPRGGVPNGKNSRGRDDMEIVRTRMEEGVRSADVLEIIQTNSEITVNETGDDRSVHTRTFYTDARKSEQDTEQEKIETQARWQGNKLIVVTKEHAGRITRTFELKSRGRELYVTLKIENERMPQAISIRSVYDKTL